MRLPESCECLIIVVAGRTDVGHHGGFAVSTQRVLNRQRNHQSAIITDTDTAHASTCLDQDAMHAFTVAHT